MKYRCLTKDDRIKIEVLLKAGVKVAKIAEELGLSEKVDECGWGGLTAEETGRIGGIMTKRKKELKLPTNDQILGRK